MKLRSKLIMDLKKFKVYHTFYFFSLIIVIIGIAAEKSALYINIHDTYYVLPFPDVSFVLFLFFFLNGIGYWLTIKIFKKKLIKALTILHTSILIGSFICYWIVVGYNKYFSLSRDSFPLFDYQELDITVLAFSTMLVIFIAQPVYIVNLLIGIFRKKTIDS